MLIGTRNSLKNVSNSGRDDADDDVAAAADGGGGCFDEHRTESRRCFLSSTAQCTVVVGTKDTAEHPLPGANVKSGNKNIGRTGCLDR